MKKYTPSMRYSFPNWVDNDYWGVYISELAAINKKYYGRF